MNDNFSDKYSSGPVQRKQTFSPAIITAIIFLLIVLFALYRGYYAFLKSDAFAQYYVSGAAKKTTSSPPPIQKNKQKHSKKKSIVNEEDEGDYAERLEIPAEQEEDSDSSNNDEIISSSNTYTDSPAPIPFPHKANPFEEAVMNGMSDISDGGKFSATKISSGYFKSTSKLLII